MIQHAMGGGQSKFWEFLFSKKILSHAYSSDIILTQQKYEYGPNSQIQIDKIKKIYLSELDLGRAEYDIWPW